MRKPPAAVLLVALLSVAVLASAWGAGAPGADEGAIRTAPDLDPDPDPDPDLDPDPDPAERVSLLIRGGFVVDGTEAPGREADVAIRGEQIVAVGPDLDVEADEVLDASGLVVAPGFIDSHNHSVTALGNPENRLNEGFIRQGVTTVIGGPDGGFAPSTIQRLLRAYEEHGIGTNVAFYVGHNGIRQEVMGNDQRRAPTPEELERMKALVREGMELGALGLSTGLMYEPGMFSETDEVVALAREVAPWGGIYDSHDRDPVHDFIGSTAEVIEVAERAGIPGKIAHFKTVGLHNQGLNRTAIELVDEARARGVDVVSDQYPYDGAATATLYGTIVVPPELRSPDFDLWEALRDPGTRDALRRASEEGIDGGFSWIRAVGYTSMRITTSPNRPELVGRYLSVLAEERGINPFDLVAELIVDSDEPIGITLGAILEEDVRELMVQPWNMIASDGAFSDGETPFGHPRSTGTFPRVLGHYVRDEGVLELEEAIYKMSGFPAAFHGYEDRGFVREGAYADLALFDPERIRDRSTWAEPHLFSEGMVHVLVNGTFVLRDETMTGEAPGRHVPLPR